MCKLMALVYSKCSFVCFTWHWHHLKHLCLQLPPLGRIWNVMLVWRKGTIKKLSLCYSIVYYYNSGQRYEQFLQVGWLYRALIVLGLALCLSSISVSLVFMVLCKKKIWLHLSLYLLVSWAWWDWLLTWLTNHRPSVLWHCWLGYVTVMMSNIWNDLVCQLGH